MEEPYSVEQVYVAFDSGSIAYQVPAQTSISIFRPNGQLLCQYPPRAKAWSLHYTGVLPPGHYAVHLEQA